MAYMDEVRRLKEWEGADDHYLVGWGVNTRRLSNEQAAEKRREVENRVRGIVAQALKGKE